MKMDKRRILIPVLVVCVLVCLSYGAVVGGEGGVDKNVTDTGGEGAVVGKGARVENPGDETDETHGREGTERDNDDDQRGRQIPVETRSDKKGEDQRSRQIPEAEGDKEEDDQRGRQGSEDNLQM